MDKNKKIIIISIAVIVVIILGIVVINLNKEETEGESNQTVVNISEVFDIEDIEKSNKEIIKNKEVEISDKYTVLDSSKYELQSKVQFDETEGKMIYVREEWNNLNIYQTMYKINKYNDTTIQIRNYMEEFERMCTGYLGIQMDEELEGNLYGESTRKLPIPIEESIYLEERLYSKTYRVEDELESKTKYYDINFYKSGENLVAEFVKDNG